jgi:hypothetical protein
VLALACVLCAAASDASAQTAGETPTPTPALARAAAPPDTTWLFPTWMHPWLEIGGGWLASPKYMRAFYESGQSFAAGIAMTPRRRLQVRTAIDYQMLLSHHTGRTVIDWGAIGGTGQPILDTLTYSFDSNAWNAILLTETGFEAGYGLWFTGGLGAGYMNGGFEDLATLSGSGLTSDLPATMRNGWGWAWTASAHWDVDLDPMVPLGVNLRTTQLKRGDDFVHWWSIRLCYRIPNAPYRTGPQRH